MRSKILFAANADIDSNLKMLFSEANQKGFVFSNAIKYHEVVQTIKDENVKIVFINAVNSKLEALELCKDLKKEFKAAVKVFVYLHQSTANEGSRFGMLNAEVEDEQSLKLFCDKLLVLDEECSIEENLVCFSSLSGSSGASFACIALTYLLEQYGSNAILLENSSSFSIRNLLSLDTNLALLSTNNDNSSKYNNDFECFKNFIYKIDNLPTSHYLNLFSNFYSKFDYLNSNYSFLQELAKELVDRSRLDEKSTAVANSLEFFYKDLQGSSFSLFNEIIGFGSKLSKNFFIDIGHDYFSAINLQFLRLAKYCLVFFTDQKQIAQDFKSLKSFLEKELKVEAVPVLACNEYNFAEFQKMPIDFWLNILGEVPLLMPSSLASIETLISADAQIYDKNYLKFLEDLSIRLAIKLQKMPFKKEGILKFLNSKEKIKCIN